MHIYFNEYKNNRKYRPMFAKSYEQQKATDTAIVLILSGFLSNRHNCCASAILAFCIGIIEKIMKKR
jgi:hypothetical protein